MLKNLTIEWLLLIRQDYCHENNHRTTEGRHGCHPKNAQQSIIKSHSKADKIDALKLCFFRSF